LVLQFVICRKQVHSLYFSVLTSFARKGTGKVATPEIAQSVHAKCRAILADMYDQEAAESVRILYGGSVTPESVDDLMNQPDIDGALVGGASLDKDKFGRIINFKTVQTAVHV
jgi:triosephosphate isomerase